MTTASSWPQDGAEPPPPGSLGEVLDRIDDAAEHHEPTSVGDILDALGHRSFGPVLVMAGLVMVAPGIGDIPGVPVMMGLVVMLVAGQLAWGHDHIWLPGWMLRRSAKHERVRKAVRWLRPVARVMDRWSKRRLTGLTRGVGVVVVALSCVVIAAATPVMEVVPMSANLAGLAITASGLALIACDGVLALLSLGFAAATFFVVVRGVLS